MDDKKTIGIKKDFGKLPHWIIDFGVLPALKGTEAKALMVLIRRADYVTGIGRVGNKRIAKESGVSYSSISYCLKQLEYAGIIKRWRQGWTRYYRILPEFSPSSESWIKFYGKGETDILPKKSVTYLRDPQTGQFIKKDT